LDLSGKIKRVAELTRQGASAPDAGRYLDAVLGTIKQLFDCRSAALLLAAEDTDELSIKASAGLSAALARDYRRPIGTAAIAEVMRSGSNLLYDRLSADDAPADEFTIEFGPVSLMCVRLEVDSRALGYVLCESAREAAFTEDDLQLLKVLAETMAVAIDREKVHRISRKLIMVDPLTQVYSYAYFHRRLTEEVERAIRLNENLAVLLLEIDNLRAFRDAHGWQETEQSLRGLVEIVSKSVRNIDVVGRYGVDEIILYLPETPREKAMLAAERIRALIEKKSKESGLTVSVGLASLPENGDTVNRLLDSVTAALLSAQRAGRNCVEAAATGAER
jgi:diguanylate cyclase (GGDEF)-like protein